MKVSVDLRGFEEAIRKAPAVILAEIGRGAKIGLTAIQRDAQVSHRFVSRRGALAKAVKMDFKSFTEPGRGLYLDSSKAPYAGWVHDGTRPHRIGPRNKAALAFTGKDGRLYVIPRNMGHPETRAYWKGQAKIHGFILGYKGYVNHPGTAADPFLFEAADRGTENLVKEMYKGVDRAIDKLGFRRK